MLAFVPTVKRCYLSGIGYLEFGQPVLIVLLRIWFGYGFFKAGLGKLQNIESTVSYFGDLGIPLPTINTCQNKGKPGTKNSCAGEAHCATVPAHDCNGMNDCKGQGGCGEHPGENECSGKGACAVPLSDKTWPKARQRFEELMSAAGKKFQNAPAKEG
jgi:hypothetical protein